MIVEITESEQLGSVLKFDTVQKLLAICNYQKTGELHVQS